MGQDFYRLLDLEPSASVAEIKRAFRLRVKRIHPDVNPGNHEASRQMRDLVRAYETLINPVLRDEYDQAFRHHRGGVPFDYPAFLREQGDPGSLSKLIFYELLHGQEDMAVDRYLDLLKAGPYEFAAHFEREDFMDCAYILAEELLRLGYQEPAFQLFFQIVQQEVRKPYFRYFFVEVIQHLRSLLATSLPAAIPIERVIIYLEKTIQAGLAPKDTAFFMKCAAELYLKRNQRARALFYFQECLRLDARATGIKDLRKKLHVG